MNETKKLSAKELFKYRQGLDATIPQKGGQKDFMPEGSWLQNKQVDKFNEERHHVLSEPRILRNDIVKGQWNSERRLVELQNEQKHFWEHMGFNENKQKWLYPEEALFLMETCVIEVWYQSLPLSIQEAYMLCFDDHVTPEYYHVYSHLRRQGFIVLRHQGRMNTTEYERKMGLDRYKSRKERKMAKRKLQKEASDETDASVTKKISSSNCTEPADITESATSNDNADESEVMETTLDSELGLQDDTPADNSVTLQKTVSESDNACEEDSPKICNNEGELKLDDNERFETSYWDFNEIIFPNFCSEGDIVTIARPDKVLFPEDFELSSEVYQYEKKKYINTKKVKRGETEEILEFSFDKNRTAKLKDGLKCTNWKDYKRELQRERESWDRQTELPHLYDDAVTPLVLPEEAFSTEAVLDKLSVIPEDVQQLQPRTVQQVPTLQPQFDVYGPNTKFKKYNPGIPDNRIIITSFEAELPDLEASTELQRYLGDSAELLWAVVGGGNIAFYAFSDFNLPRDVFIG